MPHELAIAVVEEAVEQLLPYFVSSEETEPRHQLQPRERERNVRVGDVPVRQQIAEHQVRLRDDRRPAQLKGLLTRLRLRDVTEDMIELHVMLTARDKAKHPNAARLLANYLMSQEGNNVLNDDPGLKSIYQSGKRVAVEYTTPGRQAQIVKLLGFDR